MLGDVVGAYGSRFLLAAGGVGLALLLLILVLWVIRRRAPSPFLRGGRNRQPRLQVLDAAAVDTRRRLVLVRRDDVEHLIMIGGPSDIVIESRILPGAAQQPESGDRPLERPVAPLVAQPVSFHDTASAAEILDAARQRVLPQQRIEPEISAPPVHVMPAAARAAPGTAEADAAAQSAAAIRGDFQRVLDEEMSNNLTAERIVPVPGNQAPRQAIPQPQPQPGNLPRRDPDLAPITGADTELQKEVARIFGEMSVNRDK